VRNGFGEITSRSQYVHGERDPPREGELAVNGGQVLLHCFFADAELVGDLPVAQAAGNRLRHLAFAAGQRFNVQHLVSGHGVLLRLGAQLPPYLPKRGRLENRTPPRFPGLEDAPATATLVLLERVRAGDTAALNSLLDRYLPRLSRWASGRLPQWARDVSDTDDLVQDTLIRSVANLDHFEARGEGALQAYLRGAVMNRIRDEIRRRRRTPAKSQLDSTIPASGQSPLETAIGTETLAKYDRALDRLEAETREAVIARLEMGCSYAEVAELLNKPSADAARMTVSRALLRLAEEMRRG
jgi:RNA polymerase sigma-70 factor, ECF subfamily